MADSKDKPVDRVSIYPVSIAIWKNTSNDGDTFYSATAQRTYKDKDGNLKNTDGFNISDMLALSKAADIAHTKMLKLRAADRAAKGKADELGEGDDIPF